MHKGHKLHQMKTEIFFKEVKLFQSISFLFNERTCIPMLVSQATEV